MCVLRWRKKQGVEEEGGLKHVLSSDKEVNSNCRAAQRFAMPFCFFFAVQPLDCRWED